MTDFSARQHEGPLAPARDGEGDGKIPAGAHLRRRIREQCARHALAAGLRPPLLLADLRRHAAAVLEEASCPAAYEKYAATWLNNALWREALAAVPFDRRMLLLPQCLRGKTCTAPSDDFGLLCRRCGQCIIGALAEEADQLGYTVLVAEGSPVVMSLIESRKVQGLVGVSCTAMLERVFPYVDASGMPALAVPLLNDGCLDTALDAEEIWEAIYLTGPAQQVGVDLEALRAQVESWFSPEALAALLGEPRTQAEQWAQAELAGAGKRWRPVLTVSVCRTLDPEADETVLRALAVAVECFHKASLVHDDIEDGDALRYGRATLHTAVGVPAALNVGDYLLGLGYELLAGCLLPPDRVRAIVQAAAAGHRQLCVGQGLELSWRQDRPPLSVAEVVEIFAHKTAPAFEVAMRIGALAAGVPDACEALSACSRELGVAYQIRDDMEDVQRDEREGDSPSILEAMNRDPASGPGMGRARTMLEDGRARAIAALRQLSDMPLRQLLRKVVAKIFRETDTMDCCHDDHQRHGVRRTPGAPDARG
ncbi:MAG: polyprenyl synthetase family protein [Planctomycetota bacterium]|nr:polyprenyl synthetase family protein [Planctomycetota bacterium]